MFESWTCEDTEPDYWGIWDDAVVLQYYTADSHGNSDCSKIVYTEVYNPNCVNSPEFNISSKVECSFSADSGSELKMYYYGDESEPQCASLDSDWDSIIHLYADDNDGNYCYDNDDYGIKLMCWKPNPAYQVMLMYTDLDVEPFVGYAHWDEFCFEYETYYDSDDDIYYVYNCDDEVVWTDYFDAEPITIDYYDSNKCDDDYYIYTYAASVGCVTIPVDSEGEFNGTSIWAYCDPNGGIMVQYRCPYDTNPEWEECIDIENIPNSDDCDGLFIFPYEPEDGDICFSDNSTYYTIDCGDVVSTSVYWVESYSTTEDGCTEPDLVSFGYFTRFCGAEDECLLDETYYVNDACIEQDELDDYLAEGVLLYSYNNDECDDDNYLNEYEFYAVECIPDEELYMVAKCTHGDLETPGSVAVGFSCTSCDIETCDTALEVEDGDCVGGIKFVCSSPPLPSSSSLSSSSPSPPIEVARISLDMEVESPEPPSFRDDFEQQMAEILGIPPSNVDCYNVTYQTTRAPAPATVSYYVNPTGTNYTAESVLNYTITMASDPNSTLHSSTFFSSVVSASGEVATLSTSSSSSSSTTSSTSSPSPSSTSSLPPSSSPSSSSPSNTSSSHLQPSSSEKDGTPGWVWAIVAVGGVAIVSGIVVAAIFIVVRRRGKVANSAN